MIRGARHRKKGYGPWAIASSILSSLFLLAALAFTGSRLYVAAARHFTGELQPTAFGYATAVVVSGSMEDAIHVDDMILTRAAPSYEEGDIIMFESGSSLVTHRIVEVTPEGYRTRGDANNAPDPALTPQEKVVGRVVLILPGAGRVIGFLQSPLGMLLLVLGALILIGAPMLLER